MTATKIPGVRFGSAVRWATVMGWGQELLSSATAFILAYLLGPQEYGAVVICLAYIGFFELFTAQGFHGSIVQRPDLDDIDLDSIFWTTLGLGVFLTIVSLAISGLVADFYELPALMIQVASIAVLARAITVVQEAKLTRQMDFKSLALRTNLSTFAGAAVGIGLALAGYGAWAVIAQYLARSLTGVAVLWRAAHWTPRWRFHRRHTREMTVFSIKFFPGTLFDFFGSQAETLVMGKFFGFTAVGVYRLAIRIVDLVILLVTRALWYVAFPYFAEARGDIDRLRARVKDCLHYATLFALPGLILLAFESPSLTAIMGPKWSQAASAIRILCLYGVLRSLVLFAGPLLFSVGKPHIQSLMMGIQCAALCAGVAVAGVVLRGLDTEVQISGIAWARVIVYAVIYLPLAAYFMVTTVRVSMRELFSVALPGLAAASAAGIADILLSSYVLPADSGAVALIGRLAVSGVVVLSVFLAMNGAMRSVVVGFVTARVGGGTNAATGPELPTPPGDSKV